MSVGDQKAGFISHEQMEGIRDSTIDMCRVYQRRYAAEGGKMPVPKEMSMEERHRFFRFYAVVDNKSYDEVKHLKEVDGFLGMGAMINMLQNAKFDNENPISE